MPVNVWEQLRRGVVGRFQPLTELGLDPAPGMIRLTDEYAEATFLAATEHLGPQSLPVDCRAVFGETQIGDVLMLPVTQRSGLNSSLATARYRSTCLVVNPPADDIDDDTVSAVRLQYLGLPSWAGERQFEEQPVVEDGKTVGWNVHVRWRNGTEVALDDGFRLRLSPAYSLKAAHDTYDVAIPLAVTIESPTRRPIHEHLLRLDAVHALLAVAHRETPLASSGGVRFTPAQQGYSDLWEEMMIGADSPARTHEFPRFGLDQLGGISGVAAWIELVLRHHRAVEPVVRHRLFANQTPESRLLTTAAAIEYWVASHRSEPWAKKQSKENYLHALAGRVAPEWLTWIGETEQWAERFWGTYNSLKHLTGPQQSPGTVHALELSGRWLLTAALLDRCAGSHAPSAHLFSRGLSLLGSQLREELWGM